MKPSLITVAHGTRTPVGNRVAVAITAHARRRLGVDGQAAYVELAAPLLADRLATLERPAVVVPLLLSSGFHLRVDLPRSVDASAQPVRMAGALGPHPLLAEVMLRRLLGAGAKPDEPVVLVAAGSRDHRAGLDLAEATRLLGRRWEAPVRLATLSGPGRSVPEAVALSRADGPVTLAPYLLAPGYFARRTAILGQVSGATRVADVIGPDPLVAELVARRYLGVLKHEVERQSRAA